MTKVVAEKTEREKALDEQAKKTREEFFEYKKTHPGSTSDKDLTPLQRRMRSGGPK